MEKEKKENPDRKFWIIFLSLASAIMFSYYTYDSYASLSFCSLSDPECLGTLLGFTTPSIIFGAVVAFPIAIIVWLLSKNKKSSLFWLSFLIPFSIVLLVLSLGVYALKGEKTATTPTKYTIDESQYKNGVSDRESTFRKSLVEACIKQNGNQAMCYCIYDTLRTKHSLKELVAMGMDYESETSTQELYNANNSAVNTCKQKLKFEE